MTACTAQFGRWGVIRQQAGGELPVPGVYGVPEQWPHIAALYRRAGFAHTGHTEIVYLARVEDLPRPAGPPNSEAGSAASALATGGTGPARVASSAARVSLSTRSARASGCRVSLRTRPARPKAVRPAGRPAACRRSP